MTIYSLSLWQPQAPSAVGSCQGGGRAALSLCAAFGGGLSGEIPCSPTVRIGTDGVVLHTLAVLVLHLSYQHLVWSMRGYSCTAGVLAQVRGGVCVV